MPTGSTRCSFCSEHIDTSNVMIAGLRGFICSGCIASSMRIIFDRLVQKGDFATLIVLLEQITDELDPTSEQAIFRPQAHAQIVQARLRNWRAELEEADRQHAAKTTAIQQQIAAAEQLLEELGNAGSTDSKPDADSDK